MSNSIGRVVLGAVLLAACASCGGSDDAPGGMVSGPAMPSFVSDRSSPAPGEVFLSAGVPSGDTVMLHFEMLYPDDWGLPHFFSVLVTLPEDPRERLLPGRTALAQALAKAGLSFESWDYSEDEREFWRRCLRLAEEMRGEFEAEGSVDLCDARIREAEAVQEFMESGRSSRYLYYARLERGPR